MYYKSETNITLYVNYTLYVDFFKRNKGISLHIYWKSLSKKVNTSNVVDDS